MGKKKTVKFHLDAFDITKEYLLIAQNSINMISIILDKVKDHDYLEIPELPAFLKLKLIDIKYDDSIKDHVYDWLFDKGLGEIIKGLNIGLARALFQIEIKKTKGKEIKIKTNLNDYLFEYKRKALKTPLPQLIRVSLESQVKFG